MSNGSTSAWVGAAWTGVGALVASPVVSAFRNLNVPFYYDLHPISFIAPALFSGLIVLATSRFRTFAIAVWLMVGAFLTFVTLEALSRGDWGDGMMDVPDEVRRQYYAVTFLADGLAAFGLIVLVLANIGLVGAERRKRIAR